MNDAVQQGDGGQPAGQQQQRAPHGLPVRQGGTALDLNSGAEAIGNLGLLGEGAQNTDDLPGDGQQQANDDDVTGNDDGGNLDGQQAADDQPAAGDEGQQSDDSKGAQGDASAGEDDGEPITSFNQLAEYLEVDPEWLYSLQDTFKADGEDVTVTLSETRTGYQRDANYRRQTQELADTRRALDQESAQRTEQFQQSMTVVGNVLQQAQQLIVGDLNSTRMQQLAVSDPGKHAQETLAINQRQQLLNQAFQLANQSYTQHMENESRERDSRTQEQMTRELNLLKVEIPEWNDDYRRDLHQYLSKNYAFEAGELDGVFEARYLSIADKAKKYDAMKALEKKTRKQVRKIPKFQKPGKPAGSAEGQNADNARYARARKRLKASGSLQDGAAAIDALSQRRKR